MPRRDLQFVQGAYYHMYNRGAGRQTIFRTDEDYRHALFLMKAVSKRCNIAWIAYTLLPNHYHWLVRQDGPAPANLLPKLVFGSYTRTFNNRYGRRGTLFEDRFDAKVVDSDDYLHQLCYYIHGNPVRHGIAITPELWPYSNYPDWIGTRHGTLVEHSFIREHFGDRQQYQARVLAYLTGNVTVAPGLRTYLEALAQA